MKEKKIGKDVIKKHGVPPILYFLQNELVIILNKIDVNLKSLENENDQTKAPNE